MTVDNSGLDIAGIGKLAEAVPKESLKKIVNTATQTFSDLVAPITKTTKGLGLLIEARLNRMTEIEKIFSADAINRAKSKIEDAGLDYNTKPNARVIIESISESSIESDESLRDIWANLIANELTSGNVHPEFPNILSKLSHRDALVLYQIAERDEQKSIRLFAAIVISALTTPALGVGIMSSFLGGVAEVTASTEYLEKIGLIKSWDSNWKLTHFGREFVVTVTDPGKKK